MARRTSLALVLGVALLQPRPALAQPAPPDLVVSAGLAASFTLVDGANGIGTGGAAVAEILSRTEDWLLGSLYAGLLLTWPHGGCGPGVVPCDVSARLFFLGIKARAIAPIPWVGPFLDLGVGISIGSTTVLDGALVQAGASGFIPHWLWGLGGPRLTVQAAARYRGDRPAPGREGVAMAKLLEGKVAAVTGAGGGIGREHALALARAGARVVVNDLGSDRHGGGKGSQMADQVVEEVKALGGEAAASYDSVATREGADGVVWTALNRFGRLDVLVNNAGILRDRTLLNMSEEDFDLVVQVHLRGTFLCTQAAARAMKAQGRGGRIINTTSLSGLLGNFGQSNYGSAKAGVYGLTRVAALELQKSGITVNAVAPVALTRMTNDLAMMKGATEKDLGPQFIAPVVVFLASELARDITGQVVGVQGGKVFLYRMETTNGVDRDPAQGPWTPEEIGAAWDRIGA